jgi:hypothetical protein
MIPTYLKILGRHVGLQCLSSLITTSLYIVLVRLNLNDVWMIKDDVVAILVLDYTGSTHCVDSL